MKHTAVKFLLEKYKSQNTLLFSDDFEQAKEMEKQQIIDSCYFGSQNLPYEIKDKSEQYYNETFKNK
jgi:hypothetical protein